MALSISISAEPITHIGAFVVTNSMFTSLLVSALLIIVALTTNKTLKSKGRPTGLQNILEMVVEGFYNMAFTITQNRNKANAFFPVFITSFLWILCNNWVGLIPGVGTIGFFEQETAAVPVQSSVVKPVYAQAPEPTIHVGQELNLPEGIAPENVVEEVNPHTGVETAHELIFVPIFRAATADLNTTLALALFSVGLTQIYGFQFLGIHYLSRYFSLKGIHSFVGILELLSETSKIISFAFRLFGNIFAGEVLLAVMAYIIPVLVPSVFYVLEIFVGFIQALVFAMLTVVFMNVATLGHGEE